MTVYLLGQPDVVVIGEQVKPQDWTLVTVAAGKAPLEPVQLQKALFLLSRNIAPEVLGPGFYEFVPYDYGPFSQKVYADAQALQAAGFMAISRPPGAQFSTYAVTPAGEQAVKSLRQAIDAAALDYLDRVVAFVQRVSFKELVSAIYKAYPEMRANSVFRD